MIFDLANSWSRLILIVLSIFLFVNSARCSEFKLKLLDELADADDLSTNSESGLDSGAGLLDQDFRRRLGQFFSPELIHRMSQILIMNSKHRQQQQQNQFNSNLNSNLFAPQATYPDIIAPAPPAPLPFSYTSNNSESSQGSGNAFIDSFRKKYKHSRPSAQGISSSTTTHATPTTNNLLHLFHRFG